MLLTTTAFGIQIEIVLIIMIVIILGLIVALVLVIRRLEFVNRKYYVIMSGKKGKDLEKVILTRFKEMDKVKANARRVTSEHKKFKGQLDSCIDKIGLVKYDAFDNQAGNLSYQIFTQDGVTERKIEVPQNYSLEKGAIERLRKFFDQFFDEER